MNHDPRRYGGQEYAPQPYDPAAEVPRRLDGYPGHDVPQPSMRPAPQEGFQARLQPEASPAVLAAASGAPASAEEGGETVTLSRAYRAHDASVQTLRLRKPSGGDLRKYGYPLRQILNSDSGRVESIEVNAAIAAKYVVALSSPAIPPSTLDAMEIQDADACYGAVVRFFLR